MFSNFSSQSNFESCTRDHPKCCSRFVLEKAWCGKQISMTRNDIEKQISLLPPDLFLLYFFSTLDISYHTMFLPVFPSVFHFRLAGPPQPCSWIFLFILQCSTSDLSWTSSTLLLSGFSFRYIRWSPSTCQTQSVLLKIQKITVMITRKRTP